jgi:hypothetical protein
MAVAGIWADVVGYCVSLEKFAEDTVRFVYAYRAQVLYLLRVVWGVITYLFCTLNGMAFLSLDVHQHHLGEFDNFVFMGGFVGEIAKIAISFSLFTVVQKILKDRFQVGVVWCRVQIEKAFKPCDRGSLAKVRWNNCLFDDSRCSVQHFRLPD